jgi:hypothetical protein
MPPSLARVIALSRLGLRSLTEAPDVPVRWVSVSELEDPTPYLEGGELLLTTGMRLTPENAAAYVARLVERGVAGLGFAVGVTHDHVPPELVAAARDQGLALLEVPKPVPFIAIGKAVSRMLAAEWYEDTTRAYQAQRELTRAALKGPGPLIARLARELGGWALLLDPSGAVRHAEPARARRHAPGLSPELARLRTTSSVSLADGGEHVVLQAIGLGGRPRAYLAVGTPDPLPHVGHTIVGAAVALLTLKSEAPRTGRDLRAELAAHLLNLPEDPEPSRRVLAIAPSTGMSMGVSPGAGPGASDLLEALEGDPAGERCLAVALDDHVAVIVPEELADQVTALVAAHGPVGMSGPTGLSAGGGPDLPHAHRQAVQALAAAQRGERGVLRYEDLPGQGLLDLLDTGAAQGFAEALLAPLEAEGLVPSLRAYVEANGQGETAARALGVHRHTLRTRMRKAARLLGRDLDDPAVRAELWIALALSANREGPIGHPGG